MTEPHLRGKCLAVAVGQGTRPPARAPSFLNRAEPAEGWKGGSSHPPPCTWASAAICQLQTQRDSNGSSAWGGRNQCPSAGLRSLLEDPGKTQLPASCRLLADFSSLRLSDCGPHPLLTPRGSPPSRVFHAAPSCNSGSGAAHSLNPPTSPSAASLCLQLEEVLCFEWLMLIHRNNPEDSP